MRRTTAVPFVLGALIVLAPLRRAHAQADAITRDVIARAVASIAERVETNYVLPDTGKMIADYLRKRLAAGAYDQIQTRAQFADRLTADLRTLNGDPHLNVRPAPPSATPGGRAGPGPQMVMRRPGANGPSAEDIEQARRENYGVRGVQRLTGNIGYLDLAIVSTSGIDESYRVIDAAMALLERTEAMIIDLRTTPGGDPSMSDYVASYFFGADSVRTLTTSSRSPALTMERWTGRVGGTRRPAVPVYLLIGPGSASGAEDLAFIFRSTGRGKLIGERSAGAGRPNRFYPAEEGFIVSVSTGRTFDPRTFKEWERVGIEPDIIAVGDTALPVAQSEALKTLASAAQDSTRRRGLDFARENLEARWHPHPIAASGLAQLAGEYDTRRVSFDGAKLWYSRQGGRSRTELIPITENLFALGESAHVDFMREGDRITAVRVLTPDGGVAVLPRTK